MTVPVAAPTRLAPEEAAEVRAAIDAVLTEGPWILGPIVAAFESELAEYLGAGEAVGVASGTDALVLAMAALGLGDEGEVLVAANEGGYAAGAARQLGLTPRAVDVDEHTMGPTPELVNAAATPEVVALVVTHLHGDAVPVEPLVAWCQERGIRLIEDCAQAHGLRVGGRHVGSAADAATYSFYPTKNLGAVGDAGAVVFGDGDAAGRARSLREYGWGPRFRSDLARGRNSRLDPLQAAVLRARLPHLDARNARRRDIARGYSDVLAGTALRLHGDVDTTVAHHAVVVTSQRDRVRDNLVADGIQTAVHYPYLVGEMPGLAVPSAEVPVASWLRDRVLSVPCFPEMTDDEVGRVCSALARAADHG